MGVLIMTNYLAIIRKLDFVDLFKYGYFLLNHAVSFDGDVIAHKDDENLFKQVTSKMNLYEYSFEYLMIHFTSDKDVNEQFPIDVRNVKGLYTFDEEAKREMEISFDIRIQLHVSPWSEKFKKLHESLQIKQSLRGIDNLWTIFGLSEEEKNKCEQLITSDIIKEVFRELYAYERPFGNQSIWTYLMRYERHSFYPKGMIGYFCDFVHVYCNFSKKQELNGEVAETTQLYSQFIAKPKAQFAELSNIVAASPISSMTEEIAGCRFSVVAPLFLYLRALYADGMIHKPSQDFIDYSKRIGGFECAVAIYLLGVVLGYDKTYDAFYESAELPFFKKRAEALKDGDTRKKVTNSVLEGNSTSFRENEEYKTASFRIGENSSLGELLANDVPNNSHLEGTLQRQKQLSFSTDEDSSHNTNILPLLWMKKKAKGKKADVRPVFDEEKYQQLKNSGYEIILRYDKTVNEAILSYGYDPEAEKKRLNKKK